MPPRNRHVQISNTKGFKSNERGNTSNDLGSASILDGSCLFHRGLAVSSNTLVEDAPVRDELCCKHDVRCFEMKTAGLVDDSSDLCHMRHV